MSIQSRDQQRAAHAIKSIESLQNDAQLKSSDLKSAVNGLPAMIHMNGLGHAFAFFLSDPNNFAERKAIVDTVFDWLKNHSYVYNNIAEQSNLTALNAVTQSNLKTHKIAQQEAQAYLLWLKKFARALLVDDEKENI